MKKIALLLLAFASTLPYYSFAWSKKGHEIVAEIAFVYLDTATKHAVEKYLMPMTIEQAGNWMDEIRKDSRYDYMTTWHYLNVEKGSQYEPAKEDNIINALNNATVALEHKDVLNDEEIKRNLLIVFHLVGDLHQPLHVGYGSDKGGNDIQVKYLKEQSNLHRVWDYEIIESEKISANDCLLLYKNFSKDEIARLKVINVENWMHEPRSLLGNVYNLNDDYVIDRAYIDRNKKVIEQQLLIAGIRLASILETVFGPDTSH